jgi:nucleotide-binding universal stress UspA family protein
MLTLHRILLASDFSASAEAALLYAAAAARQAQASLLVLHVLDTRVTALRRWTEIFRATDLFAAQEAYAAKAMEQLLVHPALAGLSVETLLPQGNPRERIVDVASYADLVIMGTRGQGGGPSKSPGRTARYVAHGSPAPVLLVPEGGGQAGVPAAGEAHWPLHNILLAVHFAHYAPSAIAWSRTLAMACQASLQVLQVIEPDKVTSYPLEAGEGLYHNVAAVKVLLRKRLAEIIPDAPEGPPLRRCIVEGKAAEVIVRQSIENGADLVVMSVHAYGALRSFFTVSTLDLVLEHVPCPLLAVPFSLSACAATIPGIGFVSAG